MNNPTEVIECDVLVVGAGPIGLLTALRLARRGWRVQVVDKQPTAYHLPRAIALDSESLRTLQTVDLAETMIDADHSLQPDVYDWRNGQGETILMIDRRQRGTSGWPNIIFSQPDVEELLETAVDEDPLSSLTRGVQVADTGAINEDLDGVTVHLSDTFTCEPRGIVRARYVVGADGARSVVRAAIGEPMVDLGFFFDWLVVDVIPTKEREWPKESIQICSTERPTTYVAGGPGRRRWEFMALPGESVEELGTEEAAWRLLEPYDVSPDNATLERHTVYKFQARWAGTWNKGRLLLAGDAAHQMPPFAGQGLNSGFRDVANLVWKLDLVLSGSADQGLLDSYSSERGEHIKHAIQYSIELGKVICVLDPEEARARDERMLALGGRPDLCLPPLPPEGFSQGIIGDPEECPAAGTVAPQFRVRSEVGEGLFDDVVGSTSILMTRASDLELDPALVARFEGLGGRVVRLGEAPGTGQVVDVTGGYGSELERLEAAALLWRPDGYYYGSASRAQGIPGLLRSYVDAVVGDREPALQGAELA